MTDIDLGFPEERESAWLTNRYFPSKVGGRPAWLELATLPENIQCAHCKGPQSLLCQLYAPFDDEDNFHRTLYVFVCRMKDCQFANSARNFTVLRSQLPRENDFYSMQPPAEEGEPLPPIPAKRKLCLACGCSGPLACSRCKSTNYCSAQHQRAHWPQHKKVCATESQSNLECTPVSLPQVLFPEWEIVIESSTHGEKSTDTADEQSRENRALAEYEKLVAEGKAGELKDVPESELDKYAQSSDEVDDKHFRKFKKEVGKDAEQIIRYKRGGSPLWIANTERTFVDGQLRPPKCEHCNAERQFEFQIMPQMLLLLKDEHLDWGVVAVFTCSRSCKPPQDIGYVREYVVKQDILADIETPKS